MYPRTRLKKRPDFVRKSHTIKDFRRLDWKAKLKLYIHKHKRKLLYLFLLFVVIMLLIPPATYLYFAKDLKSKESIMNRQETGLTLLDRDGEEFYSFDVAKT